MKNRVLCLVIHNLFISFYVTLITRTISFARDILNEAVKYNQALYYDHDIQLRIKINTEFL
jgi:hypothetical protein